MSQIHGQDGPPRTFMIALDFGTTKSAAAFRIAHSDGPPRRYDIIEIEQGIRREKTAPMIAAWLNDEFVCGHELQTLIDKGQVAEEKVMRFFKLLLYDDWQESESAQHIARILQEAGKSKEDLFTAVLKRMYLTAQEHIRKHAKNKYDMDNIPKKVYLTVPKNASFSARQLLASSCKRAGIPQCILVSEPLCAAAYNLQSLADDEMAAGLIGKHIVVLDGGGGTVDIATFTWNSDPTDGARTKFEMIGDAHAGLCGAEYVGDAFIEWFQTQCPRVMNRGGIQGTAEYMSKSPTQLRAQARKEFEQVKRNFRPESGDDKIFLIGGTSEQPVTICVALLWTTVQTFFEKAVQKVLDLIGLHFTDHTEFIICTGGFGMSPYLQHRIKEAYPNLRMLQPHGPDCYFPVCKGALLRFDVIDTTQLRSLYAFGVTQGEVFDRENHPDGVVGSTFVDTDGVRVEAGSIDLRVVKHDFLDPKLDVVEDRIQWLIKQNNAPGEDGWYVSRPLWQRGYPEVYGPRARKFSVSVVVTKRPPERLHDSAPLIDKVTGQIFPDLHILAEREVKLDLEQARRYKTVERQRGGKEFKCYQVWSTVVLRHNNESLQVGIAFAAPEDSPYDCNAKLKADVAIETLQMSAVHWPFPESQTHAIWDHRYDPHVHDMIGSTVRQDDDATARVQPQQPPRWPAPNHAEGSQVVPGHAGPHRRSPTLSPLTHREDEQHDTPVANLPRRTNPRRRSNSTVDTNNVRGRGMTAKRSRGNPRLRAR